MLVLGWLSLVWDEFVTNFVCVVLSLFCFLCMFANDYVFVLNVGCWMVNSVVLFCWRVLLF